MFTGVSLRPLGVMFGVSTATAQRVVWRVCRAVNQHLTPKHICWPSRADIASHAQAVQETHGIPHVAGFVDGSHIRVMPGNTLERVYCYNRKGWHSVILQGIVSQSGRFLDCHIGWPGRVHDARVFSQCHLVQRMLTSQEDSSPLPEPFVLITDSAYPMSSWSIPPYPAPTTVQERAFNTRHSSARMAVERAFGKLKAQWSLLSKNMSYCASAMPHLTVAACTLHNITIDVEDDAGWHPGPDVILADAGAFNAGGDDAFEHELEGAGNGDRHTLAAGRHKRSLLSEAMMEAIVVGAGVL